MQPFFPPTLSGDICDHSAFFLPNTGRTRGNETKNKEEKRTTINTKMIYKYILWCLFSNPFKRTHTRTHTCTHALVHILKKQGGCLLIYYMPGMGMWLLRSVIAALETFLGGAWHILKGKT